MIEKLISMMMHIYGDRWHLRAKSKAFIVSILLKNASNFLLQRNVSQN
ncbi:MAG: hypothetical protein OCU16_06325 [Candidatus Methanospirare jalkutatii]|nr:hypothetical protein [Candidatus Methanospirare jalkutatii]